MNPEKVVKTAIEGGEAGKGHAQMSMLERQRANTKTRIVIKDSGVYKFESSD